MKLAVSQSVPSPCIQICHLDEATGWCAGCRRTLDEIAAWPALGDKAKQAVWAELEKRLQPKR